MPETFAFYGGVDFSGAKEPLSNLWTAIGEEVDGRLRIRSVRPHAFRMDLADYVSNSWREGIDDGNGRILWGVDFPFGLPDNVAEALVPGGMWSRVIDWVADRPANEVRAAAGEATRALRATDSNGALAPLDLRLYKQTVEGFRWLQELREEGNGISIRPQASADDSRVTLIEVYPTATAKELGLPRRRTPSRPGEARARAAALRTYLDFASPDCESLVVCLEDAWDATIACLTAYLCRDDLDQPFRTKAAPKDRLAREGWIYRPPAALT